MKSILKTLTVFLLTLCVLPVFSQAIKINDSGYVGVGGEPGSPYKLKVYGPIYSSSYLYTASSVSCNGITNRGSSFYLQSGNMSMYSGSDAHVGIGIPYATDAILKVGGESTTHALYVDGASEFTQTPYWPSDGRFKKDVKDIDEDMLDKLLNVNVKEYQYKSRDEFRELHKKGVLKFNLSKISFKDTLTGEEKIRERLDIPKFPKGTQRGVLAEELQNVFPDLVKMDSITGFYSVKYIDFIPILIESIQEQNKAVQEQQKEIVALKREIEQLKKE